MKQVMAKLHAAVWLAAGSIIPLAPAGVSAQSVCLPAPRLLTTMPMGGQAGSTVEVNITGDHLDGADELMFSHPGISATPVLGGDGKPIPNRYTVAIAEDCPAGIYEARVMTRLGVSSSRIFNVGALPEKTRAISNTTLETALPLEMNSICNAAMTNRAVDYYSFEAEKGQRIIVDCAAAGIDSKLKHVLIIADEGGADLLVERRGGWLDFAVPASGTYIVKLHDLTFNGGPAYFYRLALRAVRADEHVERLPAVSAVSAFSWPPEGLTNDAMRDESEPNNGHDQAQSITLPCDISGSFFPAADVDTFEFPAKKGEVWWVEVASDRLGRPTDPSIVVQKVTRDENGEMLTDLAELSDIPSPVKTSSNGYAYDGPPYNAGSSDIIGKLEFKEDGVYRLQLRDLFGGTRNDPRNVYRLIIRRAAPDFALVGWALHMELRNGDRNALSKPIALRGGATMPIEVVAVRRDGFDGAITLAMDQLPPGVTATGTTIPAGQSRGIMLITADADAPQGFSIASFVGRATIGNEVVTRPCRLASMQWPVPDASREIPSPRLLADVPVSVCGDERAPITIAAAEDKVWEAVVGEKLTIPLVHTRRCEFSGATISLKAWGAAFERMPAFDAPLNSDASQAVLDLAVLKTTPGEHVVAFYGSAVAKYRYHPAAVTSAETALQQAQQQAREVAAEAVRLAAEAQQASAESKAKAQQTAQEAEARRKVAEQAVAAADKRLKAAVTKAQPKDIVDIVVSKPITIRVRPADQ